MAATDAPATLSEMRTAFLDFLKEVTGVTAINNIADRMLNEANQDIHRERQWWQERRSTIRTFAPYTTGTIDIAITNLTTRRTVTGTDTLWNTANSFGDTNAQVGMKMTLGSTVNVHLINAVGSNTSITLETSTPYMGTAALDDAGYTVYQDEYALASDFDDVIDVKSFDLDQHIELVGPVEFNRRRARNSFRSSPKCATILELGPSGAVTLRPRVLFGPAPDAAYIIPYRYLTTSIALTSAGVGSANLSAATDEPIVPLRFRMAIVFKALELWFGSRQKNPDAETRFKGRYDELILRARQKTTEADDRPRLVPDVAGYWSHAKRPYRGARRYDGDSAWDQMRI